MISSLGIIQGKALPAPVAISATDVLTISFTARTNASYNAISYRLDVSTASNFSSFVTGYNNLTVSGTSQAVTGLIEDTTYYYRWRSARLTRTSANSNTITQKTDLIVAPATPTGLTVDEAGGKRFYASWNTSSGATGYKIRFRVNGGAWTEVDKGTSTTHLSTLSYDSCDFIEVQVLAYNSAGDSAWSATASVFIDCF